MDVTQFFFFFWPRHAACGILFPWPGIEHVPPALEAWSLNHWTPRKVPDVTQFDYPIAHVSIDTYALCPVFVIMNNATINIHIEVLSSHKYMEVGLLGHMVSAHLTVRETANFFQKWLYQHQCMREFLVYHTLINRIVVAVIVRFF